MVTDNRLPDADSRASAQTSQAGPEVDSGSATHAGNGASGNGEQRGTPTDGLSEVASRFIEELLGSASRLTEIYGDRMRLAVRRSIVRVALAAMGAICVVIWLGAAALTMLRGLCGGIAELTGRAWLGEFAGGALALLLVAGVAALGLRIAKRRELRRLEAKYERNPSKRGEAPEHAPSENA